MSRLFAAVIVACFPLARAADLTGRWDFTHADDRFRGTIVLREADAVLSGTWHTNFGKSEADTPVSGRVDGNIVMLTRFIGPNRQVYLLTLSKDGSRLDGFGEGFFLSHTNLNMQRRIAASTAQKAGAEPIELSGTWIFAHDGDRFQGIITLSQTGSDLSGSWHTTKGKSEADTSVAG